MLLSLRTVRRSVGVAGAKIRVGELPGGRVVWFVIAFASAPVIAPALVPFVMGVEGMGFGG